MFSPFLRLSEKGLGYLLTIPALLLIAIFALYPVLNSLWLSLHFIVLALPGLEEPFIGLENYRALLEDSELRVSLMITLFFVTLSTLIEIILGLLIALIINRKFLGRGMIRASVLIPWAIPTVVASQMWRFIFNDQYGLSNYLLFGSDTSHYMAWLASPTTAFAALVVADAWKTSSFAALILLAGLQSIPEELYEASRIDGAHAWQQFRMITLPLLRPALLLALLFRSIDAFKVFDLVFVMTQGGPANSTSVLQFYGYKRLFTEGDMGYGSAVSVLVFLIIFLLSISYIKLIGSRLMAKEG
jgi:multiple sugar transport system permease protein